MRILVVDDEHLARARLVRMLGRIAGTVVVGEADNGAAALQLAKTLKPDVLLLDIEMPGLDGLAVAERAGLPPIVFTTAHPQFAAEAFDADAVDYLVKPVRQDRLERALDKVLRRRAAPIATLAAQITVHGAGGVRLIDAHRLTVLRALDKYVEFTFEGEQLLTRESLDALEPRLADLGFIRVHRAALVRRDAIVELRPGGRVTSVRLVDGSSVEVSRRQVAPLRRLLGLHR